MRGNSDAQQSGKRNQAAAADTAVDKSCDKAKKGQKKDSSEIKVHEQITCFGLVKEYKKSNTV
ncbi:hypothetical protein GCM10023228_31680 [Brevibacillus fulvus]